MAEYDTFILTDLNEAVLDTEQDMVIRDLTPGRGKYCCKCVRAKISNDPDKYPDRLWPRLGRGQEVGQPWSVEVIKFVNRIPEQWR
jgi:phenylphosphate carboxylase gamma subunit